MKKLYEQDLSLEDLKSMLKGFRRKKFDNTLGIILGIACIMVLTAAIIFISLKLKSKNVYDDYDEFDDEFEDEFDDEFVDEYNSKDCDENGCRFTNENDFEK